MDHSEDKATSDTLDGLLDDLVLVDEELQEIRRNIQK